LNHELSNLQKVLSRLIGEDIILKVTLEEGLWNVEIDPTQVTQILTNLASNARDAIRNVGTISIETSNVVINSALPNTTSEILPGEYVVLSFSDTGSGIGKEILPHIFEPFYTTKAKGEGTGLGLATVFGIIKQNGGHINVYSEVNIGTTFKIYLPRYSGETEIHNIESKEIPLDGNETILIVEDEEALLQLANTALSGYKYTVLVAKSPAEALMICEGYKKNINLLITDVVMPGMNGKELRDRIVKTYPSIKTLYMSGYTSDIVAHRGILEEGINFLQKPFTPLRLVRRVREILNG
jgi:CheY-like chemotaxis protein